MQRGEGQKAGTPTSVRFTRHFLKQRLLQGQSLEATSWSSSRAGHRGPSLHPSAAVPWGWRPKGLCHALSHSPVHASDELLQLPHTGPGFKVLHARLPVSANVHVELSLVSLGVYQARLAGQDEWAQPDGVDLRGPGRRVLVLFSSRLQAPSWPTAHLLRALQLSPGAPPLAAHSFALTPELR